MEDTTLDQSAATENSTSMDPIFYMAAVKGDSNTIRHYKEHLDLHLHLQRQLTPNRNTVLHVYIMAPSESEKSTEFVDEILEMCPPLLLQVNAKNETPLHLAARHGHVAVVDYLIQAAKPKYGPPEDPEIGVGPLEDTKSEVEEVRKMLRMKNTPGDTAIHEAVRNNHLDVLQSLIKLEDPDFSYPANRAGETPVDLAKERGYPDLVFKIRTTCTRPEDDCPIDPSPTELHTAVILNNQEMIKEILSNEDKRSRTIKYKDQQGWIPLHYAALYGHELTVKLLLDSEKSTAYIGNENENKTALHIATGQGHIGVIEQLLSSCPDCCEVVDNNDQNALDVALAISDSKAKKKIVKCLEGVGCRPNIGKITYDIIDEFKRGEDPHLLVAILIATVTFAACFTMPGGYINEMGPEQGQAILRRSSAFEAFLINNTIALMLSSFSVMAHLFAPLCKGKREITLLFWSQFYCIAFAMLAMVMAFSTAIFGVLRQSAALSITTLVIVTVYSTIVMVFGLIALCCPKLGDQSRPKLYDQFFTKLNNYWSSRGRKKSTTSIKESHTGGELSGTVSKTPTMLSKCTNYVYHLFTRFTSTLRSIDQRLSSTENFGSLDFGSREDYYRKIKVSNLNVSILVATVTFAAGTTMPGGYVGNNGLDPGSATLTRSKAFQAFAVTDTFALAFSSLSVFTHLFLVMRDYNKTGILAYSEYQWLITADSVIFMVIAYVTGTYAVLVHSSRLAIANLVIGSAFVFFLFLVWGWFIGQQDVK